MHHCLIQRWFWVLQHEAIINKLHIPLTIILSQIHSSFHIVFYFPFHIYNRVRNVVKHIILNMYDIQITPDNISLIIKKLLKNTLFYLNVGHTKTKKFPYTIMKIKYNAFMLKGYIIYFFTQQYWQCNIYFSFTFQEVHYVIF